MKITSYKQTTSDSCLPVCLLILRGQTFSQEDEIELFINGAKSFRDNYALGILDFFSTKYKINAEVYVDNKYYFKFLRKFISNGKVNLVNQKITPKFIKENKTPFILYLDKHFLGSYEHSPHFVIVENCSNEDYYIVDPWFGKRRKIKREVVLDAVGSLRSHLRFCPFLIKLAPITQKSR